MFIEAAPVQNQSDRQSAASIRSMKERAKAESPSTASEAVRVQRLREDARRPLDVNLAEGIALSHKLIRFSGSALRS